MRRAFLSLCLSLLGALCLAAPASAAFGIERAEVEFLDSGDAPTRLAGSHPFATATTIEMNTLAVKEGQTGEGEDCAAIACKLPDGGAKDLAIDLPAGFAGDPFAVPRCPAIDFATIDEAQPSCADATALGYVSLEIEFEPLPADNETFLHVPVYNLAPPPGAAARIGFAGLGVPVTVDFTLAPNPPYNIRARTDNIAQAVHFYGSVLRAWGVPHSEAHDELRGKCLDSLLPAPLGEPPSSGSCPVKSNAPRAFITSPRSCTGPLSSRFRVTAWNTGQADEAIAKTEPGMVDCPALRLAPEIAARPTSDDADGPTGLEFNLEIDDPGLSSAKEGARAHSDIRKALVTLPEGMTINPSQAEGLEVCSESELARESADSEFGEGCPAASKIGSVEVQSALLEDEVLHGQIFVAEPFANRFGSLLAIYQVIKSPERGIAIKLAGEVEPDPETGQLITTFEDLPQLPFSQFRLRFREGARSPLITPPSCGTYEVKAKLTPWANPGAPVSASSSFEIDDGVGGGPCPPGGTPPFEPGFAAGSANPIAAAHSPFLMRLTRRDGDADLTRFDAVLPPGVTAKLAGVPWCPDHAIARARNRDGKDELRSPSCPLASQIGTVQGGAGVGSQLTYVPGKVYLAGPVGGAPISVVGIVPAVAGPFDVGTIVVRQALDLDPITGQARVVSGASDALPHILAGIPLRVRDIQVSVDRPNFTLNPTSCRPMGTLAGIWGGGADVFSAHDDFPVLRQARFQAAGCASLGFEPKLAIKLKGGVKRGAHPALRAHVRPRPGDANFSRAVVTLPTSAFLEQAHIRTICTRVQFAAGPGHGAHCPAGARYGTARAWSPLLDGPVSGPVYLRSSDNNLPDLIAALTGPPSAAVQVELSARIDSVKGGIRSTFAAIPDLPVSRFILDMQGGRKGLIVNSRHLCHKPGRNRARANLRGQNGRLSKTRPRVVAVKCAKRRKAKRKRARRSAGHLARASAVGRGER